MSVFDDAFARFRVDRAGNDARHVAAHIFDQRLARGTMHSFDDEIGGWHMIFIGRR